jgi:2-hydroxychromene-2-carboxylate isomerase
VRSLRCAQSSSRTNTVNSWSFRANTEEVIARGGFGSPTMFVDGSDMYFGNDRLPLVEAALTR